MTRETAVIQAEHVLRALENTATRIGRALTVHADAAPPGEAFSLALESAETAHPELLAELAARSPGEPYRTFLLYLARRLAATRLRRRRPGLRQRRGLPPRPAAGPGVAGGGRCHPAGVR